MVFLVYPLKIKSPLYYHLLNHWRTRKINVYSKKEQLLVFLSKTGKVQLGVFKDITYRGKKK